MPDPSPNPVHPHARAPWWFRLIRVLLNLALLSLLGLQLFAFIILSGSIHLRLPAFAQAALEERLQEQGLSVRFSSLEASPTGSLLVLDPKVYLTGSTEPVIEAEYLQVEPDWLALLWSRRLSFSAICFGHATFYCPPENSPSGTRAPFVTNLGLGLASQGNSWWKLDYLRGNFLTVQLRAEGNFVLPANLQPPTLPTNHAATPPPTAPLLSLAARYRQFARGMLDLRHKFDLADHPTIQIDISGENSGLNKLEFFARAENAHLPNPGLELVRPWARLAASWDGNTLRALSPAQAWAQSARYTVTQSNGDKNVVALSGPTWAELQLAEGNEGIFSGWPKHAVLYSLSTRLNDFPLDSLEADLDLQSWPALPFSATLFHGSDRLNISGQTDFAEQDGTLEWRGGTFAFQAQAGLDTLLLATHQQLPARLAALKLDAALSLEGHATVLPSGPLQSMDLNLRTAGAHFERIDLDALRGHASFSRNDVGDPIVNVTKAEFDNRTWQVAGSYSQNLHTNDFALRVLGDIEPRVLDPYFDNWWAEVWKIVAPGGEWPQADVVYAGNWDGPDWQNTIWVGAKIAHARARGVRMDDIFVRVAQRPEILSVYDLVGHASGGGLLKGALLWTMKPPNEQTYEQRMIFDSTLPLADIGLIGGPEAAQAIHLVESKSPPTIHFDQRTGGSANPQPRVTVSKIHAEFSSPLEVYRVPLENAVVDATAYDGFTDIPHLEFGLAGGQATAKATVTTETDGNTELQFSLLEQNARHTDFLSALGRFSTNDNAPAAMPTIPANVTPATKNSGAILGDSAHPGLFDFSLGGRLILGQPDSFMATGQARLRDAQLGELQLLGSLSRMLADTKVPLGNFALNAATSDLQIARQYLRLPNLVVTGPSARIVAAGTYNFPGDDLDFNALIFPVGQWDTGVLKEISRVMNPFSNTITLKLHGKIAQPVWNLSMDPLRLFKDQTVEGPTIPGVPASADHTPILPPLPPAPPLPELTAQKKN